MLDHNRCILLIISNHTIVALSFFGFDVSALASRCA